MFGIFKKKEPPKEPPIQFPPVPDWKPRIAQPLEKIIDRMKYYTNGSKDFVIFQNGTLVVVADDQSDEQAALYAKDVLKRILHAHPDINPTNMDDGNLLVRYNHPAANIVLSDFSASNWAEIESNHQRALVTAEVLTTPLGPNVFDDFGKKALFGRCYMFMDALELKVAHIVRKAS